MAAEKQRAADAFMAYKMAELARNMAEQQNGGGIAGGGDGTDACGAGSPIGGASGTVGTGNAGATNTAADSAGACGASATSADVWFNYTAPCTGTVTFSFCPAQGGSSTYDTVLEAYSNCLSAGGARIICNDDTCGLQSSITFPIVNATVYKIRVSGFSTNTGTGTLGWTTNCGGGGPPNDNCTSPTAIGNGTFHFDTTNATTSGIAASCAPMGPDVWFCYTATCNGTGTATTCLNGVAGMDTVLQVWDTCTCPPTVSVGCNDDGPPTCPGSDGFSGSTVNFTAVQGHTYLIQVGHYSAGGGQADLTTSCAPAQPCPPCPSGAFIENEPDCAPNYIDATNGGCNSTPNVFQDVQCGTTICGRTGTYLFNGLNYRDTDWYRICHNGGDITVTAAGNFPVRLFILTGVCPTSVIATNASSIPCTPVSVTAAAQPPGTYFIFVGPDVFTGVPCGTAYIANISCTSCQATEPLGACCIGNACTILNRFDCALQSGDWQGPSTSCANAQCGVTVPCFGQLAGDSNCDGVINNFDIQCFVLALTNPAGWSSSCSHGGQCNFICVNDVNGDGLVNNFDIDPFVFLLTHTIVRRPICANCQAINDHFDECLHFGENDACRTDECIRNNRNSASCEFFPDNRDAPDCNTDTDNTRPKVVQERRTQSCSSNVGWHRWYTMYFGCTSCARQTGWVRCDTPDCSGPVTDTADRGVRHRCGCP